MKKERTASKIGSNEFAEYIDDQQICIKEGVPCHHGIPCCKGCSTSGVDPIIIGTPPLIGRDAGTELGFGVMSVGAIDHEHWFPMPVALIDHWLPTPEGEERNEDEGPKLNIAHLIRPINLIKVKEGE